MRYAAVDCGTNSIRLLVSEQAADGSLVELDRRLEMVRLGQGVDATGAFHPDALARTFAATQEYARIIADLGVDRVRFVATSAARDAENSEEFFAGIEERIGVRPEIISGDEEARLSFAGAVSGVPGLPEPVLVIDIGGGSTELILGRGTEIEQAASVDVGSVRIRERFLHDDPPTVDQVLQAQRYVDDLLALSAVELSQAASWIGVAGTVTTLAGVYLELPAYDRERVHGCRIGVSDVIESCADIIATPVEELRAIPSMHPKRADVIAAGALICARVAVQVGASELVVSESDILDGLIMAMAETR